MWNLKRNDTNEIAKQKETHRLREYLIKWHHLNPDFPGGAVVKNPPDDVWSLGGEAPLEKEMATHSSVLAWRIPRTEQPGGLQSMGWQIIGHNWTGNTPHRQTDRQTDRQTHTHIWTQDYQTPDAEFFIPILLFLSLGNTHDQGKFSSRNTDNDKQVRLHREGFSWDCGMYFLGTFH